MRKTIALKDNLKVLKPAYYDRFSCIGGECGSTCCANWDILLTKKEYLRTKETPLCHSVEKEQGRVFKRLRNNDSNGGYVKVHLDERGLCPLLTEDGLCGLQLNYGHQMLSKTCQEFPRKRALAAGHMVETLSLGCEAVLGLLFEYPDGVPLVAEERKQDVESLQYLDEEQRPVFRYYPQLFLLSHLILQEKSMPMPDRLLYLGFVLQDVDRLERQGEEEKIPQRIQEAMAAMGEGAVEMFAQVKGQKVLQILRAMEIMQILFLSTNKLDRQLLMRIMENLKLTHNIEKTNHIISGTLTVNIGVVEAAEQSFSAFLGERSYIMENIIVAWFTDLNFPFCLKDMSIWENYLLFVGLAQMLHFMAVGYMGTDGTMDDFIRIITMCSRNLTHNRNRMEKLVAYLKKEEMDSLAYMAILLK